MGEEPGNEAIDLIRETISYYVTHFGMAKRTNVPLSAMCTAVSEEASKDSSRSVLLILRGPKLDEIVGKSY